MTEVEYWTKLVGNVGFPMFVAVYLLVYQSRLTRELTSAIKHLTTAIDVLIGKE